MEDKNAKKEKSFQKEKILQQKSKERLILFIKKSGAILDQKSWDAFIKINPVIFNRNHNP